MFYATLRAVRTSYDKREPFAQYKIIYCTGTGNKNNAYLVQYAALEVLPGVLAVDAFQFQVLRALPQHGRPLPFLDALHLHGRHARLLARRQLHVHQTVRRQPPRLLVGHPAAAADDQRARTARFRVVVARVLAVARRVRIPRHRHFREPAQRLAPHGHRRRVVGRRRAYRRRVLLFHDTFIAPAVWFSASTHV